MRMGGWFVLTGLFLLSTIALAQEGGPPAPPDLTGYWEIDPDDSATYPISFISDVWNEVRNGNGVLSGVYLKNKNPFEPYEQVHIERILINDIYLAYLDTKENQTFLQPIYVFEGNFSARGSKGGDVVIYYPAIQPEFIN